MAVVNGIECKKVINDCCSHCRTFWRHFLLPSSHTPDGDGLTWVRSTQHDIEGIMLL